MKSLKTILRQKLIEKRDDLFPDLFPDDAPDWGRLRDNIIGPDLDNFREWHLVDPDETWPGPEHWDGPPPPGGWIQDWPPGKVYEIFRNIRTGRYRWRLVDAPGTRTIDPIPRQPPSKIPPVPPWWQGPPGAWSQFFRQILRWAPWVAAAFINNQAGPPPLPETMQYRYRDRFGNVWWLHGDNDVGFYFEDGHGHRYMGDPSELQPYWYRPEFDSTNYYNQDAPYSTDSEGEGSGGNGGGNGGGHIGGGHIGDQHGNANESYSIKDKIKRKIYEHLLKEQEMPEGEGDGWLGNWPNWIPHNLYPLLGPGEGPALPVWIWNPNDNTWYQVYYSHNPPGWVRIIEQRPGDVGHPPNGLFWKPGMKYPEKQNPVLPPRPPTIPARPARPITNPNPWWDPWGEVPGHPLWDPIHNVPLKPLPFQLD